MWLMAGISLHYCLCSFRVILGTLLVDFSLTLGARSLEGLRDRCGTAFSFIVTPFCESFQKHFCLAQLARARGHADFLEQELLEATRCFPMEEQNQSLNHENM